MFKPQHLFASADALVESPAMEPEPPDKKIIKDTSTNKPHTAKRTKFPSKKRRGGASYTKTPIRRSLDIVCRIRTFPVFTSNLGCHRLAQITHSVIHGKDFRLAENITELQLEYILTLAYCNRVVQVALSYGYAFPQDASRLKQVTSGIQLPDMLAKYIESIGAVTMLNGCTVVPFAGNYRQMFPIGTELMLAPDDILVRAERPIPIGDWSIDTNWIVAYNNATTRAGRSGMRFRAVDNSTVNGRVEMLVSYEEMPDGMITPKAPQIMTESEAQLGACYSFRNRANIGEWFGLNHELVFDAFIAVSIDPQVVFSDACVSAFAGANVSTN